MTNPMMTTVEVGSLDFRPLGRRRRLLDLTQAAVGELVGVGGAAVSNWERNKRVPSSLMLARLARALGTPYFDLLDVVESKAGAR